jgi:hypothetical protein
MPSAEIASYKAGFVQVDLSAPIQVSNLDHFRFADRPAVIA